MEQPGSQGRYPLTYRICSHDRTNPVRPVEVHATPEEIIRFAEQGYLVRERLFSMEQVERLRNALDEVVAQEVGERLPEVSSTRRFGGLFLRHLMDKHPTFLKLLRFPPTLSVARALLGPQVRVLPMTARITYPGQPNQETHWHFHQRLIPNPLPPFFARPHVIDCLIYLDEVNDANGTLTLVPGSHNWIHQELKLDDYADKEGQVTLRLPAGSCVMIHGGLWHRASPTTPQGTIRRLLFLPYAAVWLKLPAFGVKPENGLTRTLLEGADQETLELLGETEGVY